MKSSSIVLHPSMGTAVVNHLRQFGDLPNRGILAGQAVDSAITDLFGKGGGVYNDLDIFRNVPRTGDIGPYERANMTAHRSEIDLCKRSSYNGMALIMEVIDTYHIKSVSRKDMLNFVNCTMAEGKMTERLTAQMVLSGFDLNCTRVAVDLATGQLVWDKNYEEFLRSRQLRITMMHTPWHTLLRLAKKAEELPGVYVDFDAAATACVAVANSRFVKQMEYDRDVSLKFGSKHLATAEAMRHRWTPYFSLESERLYQNRSKSWVTDLPELAPGQELKTVDLYQMFPRGDIDGQLQRRCDMTGKGVLFFASKIVEESRRAKPGNAKQKLSAIMAHRAKVSGKPELDYVLRCAKMFGSDYVQGQALPEVADKVAEWLKKHSFFTKHLLGMSLAQQYARMQEITEVSRDFGNKYYDGDVEAALGVLETQATAMDLDSREKMEALLLADYQRNLAPFDVKPLPLPAAGTWPAEFKDFTVTELLTPEELRKEGVEMAHCVGGYAHKVRSNRSRILRIKYLGQRNSVNCSTVELTDRNSPTIREPFDLYIVQNRSVKNQTPSPINDAFVQYLKSYLHVAHLMESSTSPAEAAFLAIKQVAVSTAAWAAGKARLERMRDELRGLEQMVYNYGTEQSERTKCAEVLGSMAGMTKSRVEELTLLAVSQAQAEGVQMVEDALALRRKAYDEFDDEPVKPLPYVQSALEVPTDTSTQEAPLKEPSLLTRLHNTWKWLWSRDQSNSIASGN